MATFTNTRKLTHVDSSDTSGALQGDALHDGATNLITSFNGTVSKDGQTGNFNYSETSGGKADFSFSVPLALRSAAVALVLDAVTAVHRGFDVAASASDADSAAGSGSGSDSSSGEGAGA